MEKELEEFGKALGNLKRAYAEKYDIDENNVGVHISDDNEVTLFKLTVNGECDCYRNYVETGIFGIS